MYIYLMKNRKTNDGYVGSTKRNPTSRWSQHLTQLAQGKHGPRFQDAWDNSSITNWDFSILHYGETEYLDDLELNFIRQHGTLNGGLCRRKIERQDKRQLVQKLLSEGMHYREIAEKAGVAIGTVSYWKQQYYGFDNPVQFKGMSKVIGN